MALSAELQWDIQVPLLRRQCLLCGLLPPPAFSGSCLHCLLPPHLPALYGWQRSSLLYCSEEQAYANSHKSFHLEPGCQRFTSGNLLHAHHPPGQHHCRYAGSHYIARRAWRGFTCISEWWPPWETWELAARYSDPNILLLISVTGIQNPNSSEKDVGKFRALILHVGQKGFRFTLQHIWWQRTKVT